jgi:hypothetical protein
MANVVVTSTGNSIKVDFGVYVGGDVPKKRTYNKGKSIFYMSLEASDAMVTVISEGSPQWNLAYTATTACFVVDSVNGVAPTSNSDLYDKLIALIA